MSYDVPRPAVRRKPWNHTKSPNKARWYKSLFQKKSSRVCCSWLTWLTEPLMTWGDTPWRSTPLAWPPASSIRCASSWKMMMFPCHEIPMKLHSWPSPNMLFFHVFSRQSFSPWHMSGSPVGRSNPQKSLRQSPIAASQKTSTDFDRHQRYHLSSAERPIGSMVISTTKRKAVQQPRFNLSPRRKKVVSESLDHEDSTNPKREPNNRWFTSSS